MMIDNYILSRLFLSEEHILTDSRVFYVFFVSWRLKFKIQAAENDRG